MLGDQTYTEVFAWGSDEEGQLGLGENRSKRYYTFPRFCSFNIILLEVSCGKDHSAMIAQNGYIYTMGSNAFGKLGINAKMRSSVSPSLVESLVKMKALKISCGFNHTAVAMSEGDVYTWGDNTNGQLGLHDIYQSVLPRKVEFKKDNFIDVSCGNQHTMCLNNSGSVYSFGMNDQGQLGIGSCSDKEHAQQTKLNMKIIQIAAANFYTLFLTHDGKIMGCGDNSGGQLGLPITKQSQQVLHPQKATVSGMDKFQFLKIAARSYSAALSNNNELIVFGQTEFDDQHAPRQVSLNDLGKVTHFSLGNNYGVAIDQSGHICSWGLNTFGQLATNSTSPRTQPNLIQALEGKRVHKVAAGESHVIAFGTNQGLSQSRSQSRLSSERRGEQLSGKISRQQSAAQLQSLLNNNRESGKFKSHTESMPIKRSFKSQSKQFTEVHNNTTTNHNNNNQSETYISRNNDWQCKQQIYINNKESQMYVSNQRSITPTQNMKIQQQIQSRSPLVQSNYPDFTQQLLTRDKSVNSIVGSNINLLQRQQKDDSYDLEAHNNTNNNNNNNHNNNNNNNNNKRAYQPRKTEDRCMSDYVQIKGQQRQPPPEINQDQNLNQRMIEVQNQSQKQKQEHNKVIKDFKILLKEKENHIVVIQSESNDNKLKLTRKIRQLEDELEQSNKKLDDYDGIEVELKNQVDENTALLQEINELRSENNKLRDHNSRQTNQAINTTASSNEQKSTKIKTQKDVRQRSNNIDDSGSFIISQITEQTPQQIQNRKQASSENTDQLSKLKISPIQNEPIKTLLNYELDNDDIQSYMKKSRPPPQQQQRRTHQDNPKQPYSMQLNKNENNYATADVQVQSPTVAVSESTPQRTKKDSFHGTPPLPQKIEKKLEPKPTTSQDFSKSNWWSSEKRDATRAQTGLKVRESNVTQESQNSMGGSYKQNLNTIKTRLSDLQRNKSALENRMKLFEERLKERKQQDN